MIKGEAMKFANKIAAGAGAAGLALFAALPVWAQEAAAAAAEATPEPVVDKGDTQETAGGNGLQGLDDLVGTTCGIRPGIQPGIYPKTNHIKQAVSDKASYKKNSQADYCNPAVPRSDKNDGCINHHKQRGSPKIALGKQDRQGC